MDPYIFISYATEDSAAATEICAALEKAGIRCWISPRDILPPMIYAPALVDAISGCSALLLLLSKRTSSA